MNKNLLRLLAIANAVKNNQNTLKRYPLMSPSSLLKIEDERDTDFSSSSEDVIELKKHKETIDLDSIYEKTLGIHIPSTTKR